MSGTPEVLRSVPASPSAAPGGTARPAGRPPRRRRALRLAGPALLALAVLLAAQVGLPAAGTAASAPTFATPVPWAGDFPDPDVLRVPGRYYAYGTSAADANVPVLTGTTLASWVTGRVPGQWVADALPAPARWALHRADGGSEVWGPSVARLAGRWVMYYAVLVRADGRHCISVATSTSPLGPFVDRSRGPVACSSDPMGSIDPELVVSGGRPYLVWKNEGVPHRSPTRIWARQLTPDGTALVPGSPAHELLHTAAPWEGNLVEGPSLQRYAGRLYLFYSANSWNSSRYAVGYAVCPSVLGPCRRVTSGPLLASAPHQLGPGGPSAFLDASGHLRVAFHAWAGPATGYPQGERTLHVARLAADAAGRLHVLGR